jgi:hypothetical protein
MRITTMRPNPFEHLLDLHTSVYALHAHPSREAHRPASSEAELGSGPKSSRGYSRIAVSAIVAMMAAIAGLTINFADIGY